MKRPKIIEPHCPFLGEIPAWRYCVVSLPIKDWPFAFRAILESVDENHNYRGIDLGMFKTYGQADDKCEKDLLNRTDWRTATEIDLVKT